MQQITTGLPDAVVDALDRAARKLGRRRADVIRLAVEQSLEDFDDFSVASHRLRNASDPVLEWEKVRRELFDTD